MSESTRPLAVVTGAGGGLGPACCAALARDGYRVVAADMNVDAAKQSVDGLADCVPMRLDVCDRASVDALAEHVTASYGRLAHCPPPPPPMESSARSNSASQGAAGQRDAGGHGSICHPTSHDHAGLLDCFRSNVGLFIDIVEHGRAAVAATGLVWRGLRGVSADRFPVTVDRWPHWGVAAGPL